MRLLRHLIDRPSLTGVLVAAGLRTTDPLAGEAADVVSGIVAHPSVDLIEVPPFDEREVAAFVGERLTRQPSGSEIDVLVRRTGGNPFFLGELLRWLPVAGSPDPVDTTLPLAVRESVRRRLVVEEVATQQVVRAAAVAGAAASLDLLAKVTGLDAVEVARALGLRPPSRARGRAGPSRHGRVVHDLVRQAVLSLLPTWERIELHHAVGMALVEGVGSSSWAAVVAHLSTARPLVDDGTLAEAAIRAAGEATEAGAFDEAAEHLALALEVTRSAGDTAERGRWLLRRAWCCGPRSGRRNPKRCSAKRRRWRNAAATVNSSPGLRCRGEVASCGRSSDGPTTSS